MKLRRTCREVTTLVLQSAERPLSGWERMSLGLHWWACQRCRDFRQQAAVMQQAMQHWRAYRDNTDIGDNTGIADTSNITDPADDTPSAAQGGKGS